MHLIQLIILPLMTYVVFYTIEFCAHLLRREICQIFFVSYLRNKCLKNVQK